MATRRDYIRVSSALRRSHAPYEVVKEVAREFEKDNPKGFSSLIFMLSSGVPKEKVEEGLKNT